MEKGQEFPYIIESPHGVGAKKTTSSPIAPAFDMDAFASKIGRSFAEQMGTPSPERQLENFEKYEEHGEEFHIKPGTELPFMVLFKNEKQYEEKRREWEYRSILSTARARKNEGGSVDSVTNPSPEERGLDPLGVEFKKERLEFLWREMPGMLAATSIYTQITSGTEYIGYTALERKKYGLAPKEPLHKVNEDLLRISVDGKGKVLVDRKGALIESVDWDYLKREKIYTDSEILQLKQEQKELALGKFDDNGSLEDPACPDSVYGAKEPSFYTLRKSVRFFLKTTGANLLFVNETTDKDEALQNNLEKPAFLGGSKKEQMEFDLRWAEYKSQKKMAELNKRAREAEQASWNFIYTMGIIESNNIPYNNQYIREHKNSQLGPSNFMTLYLWMAMHPQFRFEKKVLRHLDGGNDDAKENWSSLGNWASNNIQARRWYGPLIDETTGKQRVDDDSKPMFGTVIPKFIRQNLVFDGLREEGNNRKVLFEYLVGKGAAILKNPLQKGISHLELYNGLVGGRWQGLPDSPFVNYRFDRLRWANAIYTVFKKGPETKGKMAVSDFAEGARMLALTQQEVTDFLIIREGIDSSRPDISPAEGGITWHYTLSTLKRNNPDLFKNYGGVRTGTEDREEF